MLLCMPKRTRFDVLFYLCIVPNCVQQIIQLQCIWNADVIMFLLKKLTFCNVIVQKSRLEYLIDG